MSRLGDHKISTFKQERVEKLIQDKEQWEEALSRMQDCFPLPAFCDPLSGVKFNIQEGKKSHRNQTPLLHYADTLPYLLIGWEQIPAAGICLIAEQTVIYSHEVVLC